MTALHTALQTFWSGFTYGTAIKAYEQGNVPGTATYPYITYEAVEGAYWGATFLTAFVWVKKVSGTDWQAQRAAILDIIKAQFPTEGVKVLAFADGNLTLRRNSVNFMSYYNDPNDASVVGGRISYEAGFYTL
jgi:hypothetical protein